MAEPPSRRQRYRSLEINEPAVVAVLSEFEAMYTNGRVLARHFVGVPDPDGRVDLRRSSLGARIRWFLRSLLEDQSIGELELPDSEMVAPLEWWDSFGSYTFEGVLIEKLLMGGMYGRGLSDTENAREVARGFVDAVAPYRGHADFLRTRHAWTPWFHEMMDDTFVMTAWGTDEWWLIATTDVD